MNLNIRAKVTVTIEIRARSHWGNDCTCKQVNDQAIEDALGQLNTMALKHGPRVIGTPKVTISYR